VDYSADLAGIAFAKKMDRKLLILSDIARSFQGNKFFPADERPNDGIPWDDFLKSYGSTDDPRFKKRRSEIIERIESLRGYKNANLF
jgi:hypothetical protein